MRKSKDGHRTASGQKVTWLTRERSRLLPQVAPADKHRPLDVSVSTPHRQKPSRYNCTPRRKKCQLTGVNRQTVPSIPSTVPPVNMAVTIPKDMKALTIGGRSMIWPLLAAVSSSYANEPVLKTVPVPKPGPGQVLVKVETFAANPTDVLHLDYIGPAGSIEGCDFVGTIVASGASATRFKLNDRVCGAVHGGKFPDRGSAAEYLVVDEDLTWKVPQGMGSHEAVTFGVGFLTAAMVLYDHFQLPHLPAQVPDKPWFLVSGGATSVGLFMTQLATAHGFRVIATASPSSFPLCKEYGAEHVVSYRDHPAALKEINEVTGGGVSKGLDCVGGKANITFAANAFSSEGGQLTSLLPGGKSPRTNVKLTDILLYRYLGKAFTFIPIMMKFPAEPEKRKALAAVCATAEEKIVQYKFKGNPVQVSSGLDAIPAGWEKLRRKQVSGKKLVYDL